jgi:O-antigen/teichoic acid export membrane protein
VLALMLPLAVGGVVLGRPLVELIYGTGYDQADEALIILSPAIAFHGLAHVAALLLVSQNRQLVLAVVQGVVAALNVAANFVLIPLISLKGAALSALGSQMLLTLLFLGYATRSAGGLDPGRVFGGPLLASVLSGITMVVLRDNLLPAVAAGGVVYVVVLAAFERVAYPDDAQAIGDFLRRRT